MTRAELEHAIRAACDLAQDAEVYVFGSQAILGQFPNAPAPLRQSMEADIAPKNRPEMVDLIDAMLGEVSQFRSTHGFYVHGVPIEAAVLPTGWDMRAVEVCNDNTRGNTGWCLDGHDLAASKLVAYRDKDREFVRVLLEHRMVEPILLRERILNLPVEDERRGLILAWLDGTVSLLAARGRDVTG